VMLASNSGVPADRGDDGCARSPSGRRGGLSDDRFVFSRSEESDRVASFLPGHEYLPMCI